MLLGLVKGIHRRVTGEYAGLGKSAIDHKVRNRVAVFRVMQ